MDIRIDSGTIHTDKLPSVWEPCFCTKCGCRVGWIHTSFVDQFVGLCDECAAIVSNDNSEDPMQCDDDDDGYNEDGEEDPMQGEYDDLVDLDDLED